MAKRLGVLFFLAVTVLLTATAYWLLFSMFMPYDDEGYVLISLKSYALHGGLYSQVFSQYGPFFYLFHDIGHRLLGYEFTNTSGRLITLVCWMMVTCAPAYLVWRQTRALTLTLFSLGQTFVYLWLMVNEPAHPGGLIAALVAAGVCGGAHLLNQKSITGLAVTAGLIGVALLLTKVNVGVFFFLSVGSWFAIQLGDIRQARLATTIAAGLLVILPPALMFTKIGEDWGRTFVIVSIVASLAMLSAAWRDRQPVTTWSQAACSGVGLLLLGALVVVAVGLRGTTPGEMIDGILLAPLRHPGIYHFAPNWQPGTTVVGGISLVLALLVWQGHTPRIAWLLCGLRLVLVTGFALAALRWLPFTSYSTVMSYAVSTAWIFVVRLSPDQGSRQIRVESWLGLVLVLQFLHAFPVAGSQIAWGTFLIIPLMALGLHDAQLFFRAKQGHTVANLVGQGIMVLSLLVIGQQTATGWLRYQQSDRLGLPGAGDLRAFEDLPRNLRLLTLNATAHGDMLFSLPGMFSFNEWTGLPPPTLRNTTHWFSLLKPDEQREIIAALERSKRPVVIVNKELLDALVEKKFPVACPLSDYLRKNFESAFRIRNFEFWVRRGRTIAPLGLAEFRQLRVPQPGLASMRLELNVAIPAGAKVARIELTTGHGEKQTLRQWDQSSGPLWCTGLSLQGDLMTPETDSGWNQRLPRLARLALPVDGFFHVRPKDCALHLCDAEGTVLAEARITD